MSLCHLNVRCTECEIMQFRNASTPGPRYRQWEPPCPGSLQATDTVRRQHIEERSVDMEALPLRLTSAMWCSFGFVGSVKRCPGFCEYQPVGPNGGSAADGVASIFAHEISEIISDPDATAW